MSIIVGEGVYAVKGGRGSQEKTPKEENLEMLSQTRKFIAEPPQLFVPTARSTEIEA